jgi:phospholipid/cholesterol/gamma-HCH transport system substrate-binding protein
MKQRGMELWLGLFVLTGLVILATLVVLFGGLLRLSRPTYDVHAEFQKVTGLRQGTPVRMLGIEIGLVKDLKFRTQGQGVEMTLQIDGDVDVPSDAVLMVLTEGLLGDNYLEFGSGTAKPLSHAGDALVEGEPFKSPQEYLRDAVTGFKGTAATYEELAKNLNKRLSDEEFFDNLKKAAAATPKTIESFKETSEKIQELTKELATRSKEVSEDLKKVSDTVSAQVNHQGENMDKLTAELLVSIGELNKTFTSLRQVAQSVEKGEGTVGGLLMRDEVYKEMVATLQQTQKTLKELEETVHFIREHPDAIWKGRQ